MVLRLLFSPVTGIAWIGEQLLERASTELDEKENLSKRLLALQLALDLGEISEEDYEVEEEELLLAIQAIEDEERANRLDA
ncbi:gas vesicle protein GvpG [Geitlerinema sp. PCC 7407]|uniref:gas vesicle protein GvpG n=1 Tax=Geitlerinema sp. PCC 7407 TaxID=1173025 RepID=UPI00029F844F|nr:gas vesicle protein GvpG [Geitlerinema sp. PCC 7407]AFY66151.1 gas vesicle protein G, GvpG [Geitlerinema sp. PCC 7407]